MDDLCSSESDFPSLILAALLFILAFLIPLNHSTHK